MFSGLPSKSLTLGNVNTVLGKQSVNVTFSYQRAVMVTACKYF